MTRAPDWWAIYNSRWDAEAAAAEEQENGSRTRIVERLVRAFGQGRTVYLLAVWRKA